MGYKNPTVRLDFDELADGCFIEMRNPKLADPDVIDVTDVTTLPDGSAFTSESQKNRYFAYAMAAKLITGWLVWDVDTGEELELPATVEKIARLPVMISSAMSREIGDALAPGRGASDPLASTPTADTPATS